MSDRVPVLALTGYLGAGKTTLLNRLLLRPGSRVGVVVNDFGAVNVDAGLVTGQVDEVGSIAGGCVCCLDDVSGLDEALERLTHPRLALDAVVVEASGIAEPGVLARLIRYSGVERVRPGGLVEVVDAVNHLATVDDGTGAPPARFGAAGLVVLNKCDLLDPATSEDVLARIEARVRQANPSMHVVRTSGGRVDPELLFDVATAQDPPDQLPFAAAQRDADGYHDHAHAASVTVDSDGPVDAAALAALLREPPPGAYRVKGTVCVDAGRARRGYVVQVVGRHSHLRRTPRAPAGSTLVAIGLDLDADTVRTRLSTALAPAGRSGLRDVQELDRLCALSE